LPFCFISLGAVFFSSSISILSLVFSFSQVSHRQHAMKPYVALLGAAAQLGWALVAPLPSPTDAATGKIDLYGITPKPTTLALLHHPDLAKRQGAGQTLLGYVCQPFGHPITPMLMTLGVTRQYLWIRERLFGRC
jgi:hypothetical protein